MVNNIPMDFSGMPHSIFPAMSAETRERFANANPTLLVSNIILQFGIPIQIKGYTYLREAIIMKVNDPQANSCVTKTLYPTVAKNHHTSAISVERAIRHAIETAWKKKDRSHCDDILSLSFSHFQKRPTNAEFIATIADRIMLLNI